MGNHCNRRWRRKVFLQAQRRGSLRVLHLVCTGSLSYLRSAWLTEKPTTTDLSIGQAAASIGCGYACRNDCRNKSYTRHNGCTARRPRKERANAELMRPPVAGLTAGWLPVSYRLAALGSSIPDRDENDQTGSQPALPLPGRPRQKSGAARPGSANRYGRPVGENYGCMETKESGHCPLSIRYGKDVPFGGIHQTVAGSILATTV